MVIKKGPVSGVRVPVKLPWKGITDNEPQFSSIKLPVAKFLKLEIATKDDLLYETKLKIKNDGDDKKGGEKTVKRRRRPTSRQRSVKVFFGDNKTGKRIKQTVGDKQVYSVQFPVTNSVSIADIIEYFETGNGKSLKVARVVNVNTGQGYPVIPA